MLPFIQLGITFAFVFLASSLQADSPDWAAIDRYVENFRQNNRIPGLAVAIVKADQIVHLKGFGFADPSGRPVTAQTPFILGSTSKSFTALAVMQLVEAGQIELDATVQRYLPWFQLASDGAASAITVRQLLNQTSGIANAAGEDSLSVTDASPDALENQVRGLSRFSLVHSPGSMFEYANANYQIAGLIVQTVTGEPFEVYVQRRLFDPLDMHRSYTTKASAQAHGLASGYRYWFGIPFPTTNMPYPRQHFPEGFYISCAEDLAHALIAHLNAGLYQGRRILSPEGMAELHRPVLANYAMGWGVNRGVLWHDGGIQDFGSQLIVDPVHQLGIAVLFNINHSRYSQPLYVLAPNILYLLTGRKVIPPPAPSAYTNAVRFLGLLLLAELTGLAWFWSRLRLWRRKPKQGPRRGWQAALLLGGPSLIEAMMAIFLWGQMTKGVRNALFFEPDLTLLILANLTLLLFGGVFRNFALFRFIKQTRTIDQAQTH